MDRYCVNCKECLKNKALYVLTYLGSFELEFCVECMNENLNIVEKRFYTSGYCLFCESKIKFIEYFVKYYGPGGTFTPEIDFCKDCYKTKVDIY